MIPVKPTSEDEPTCADCGARPVRMNLGTIPLCDRCFDTRTAASTGWPRLPEPPPPDTIAGPDRRLHRIVYRLWRSPGGVAVEAEEDGEPFDGWEFRLSFRHEDVDADEREPAVDPAGAPVPSARTPDARLH